ncbi:MAG: MoaD/ThiS family protein [Kiritimatiellia bacterium]|jgi:molybdopterin synthase sulfur carrier subunit|nr:MoaD/ThiS family protein [Kiritimatiellia bacterium]
MSVTVRISSSFNSLMRGQRDVVVDAADVAGVIDALDADYPGMKDRLCDGDGELRRFNMICVDCVDVRSLQGPSTPTPPGSEVEIISAIAGG